MHLDKEDFNVYMFLKLGLAIQLFLILPRIPALLVLILIASTYRSVVASICGLQVMPIMDLNCFYSNDKAVTNMISCTPMTIARPEYAREAFGRIVDAHLKARSSTVKVFGDMYYKELDRESVLNSQIGLLPDGQLKNKEDLANFVAETIPVKFADEEPKWRVWV